MTYHATCWSLYVYLVAIKMSILSQKKLGHHEIQLAQPLRTIKPPYSMGSSFSSRGKAVRSEINHKPQYSAEVNDECSYTSKPPICLQSMEKENVHFKSVFQCTNDLRKRLVWGVCMNNKENKWGLSKIPRILYYSKAKGIPTTKNRLDGSLDVRERTE